MTNTSRNIWFALADDGSGRVSPINWQGRLAIAVFALLFLGSALAPLAISQSAGMPLVAILGLFMPFVMIIPFLFVVRAHLDSTQTRSQYRSAVARDGEST